MKNFYDYALYNTYIYICMYVYIYIYTHMHQGLPWWLVNGKESACNAGDTGLILG